MKLPRGFSILLLLTLLIATAIAVFTLLPKPTRNTLVARVVFEYYLRRDAREIDKQAHSGESNVYYFTSYYLNGMLSAAEAIHSSRLMERCIHTINTMISTAVDINEKQDTYRAWGPFSMTPGSLAKKADLHATLQAAVPVARAAAVILRDPAFKSRYADSARDYVDFVNNAIFEFWYKNEFDGHVPWLDSEIQPNWNENSTNLALCATYLYEATGEARYGDIARQIGQAFQKELSRSGRGWIWDSNTIQIGFEMDNTPGSVGNQAGVPDTARSNRECMMMIAMYEAGLVFTKDDIERMSFTFIDNIWNQSYDKPSFANYITGSNQAYRIYKEPGLNGAIYQGWALTGGYSPQAQAVLMSTLTAILRGNDDRLLRDKTGYGGMISLSGNILRNYSIGSGS